MPRCMQPEPQRRRYIPPEQHRRNHNHNNRVAIPPYIGTNHLPHIRARPRIFERQRFVPSIPAPVLHRMPNSSIPPRHPLIAYPTPPVHPYLPIPYQPASSSRPQNGASSSNAISQNLAYQPSSSSRPQNETSSSNSNSQRREEPEYITLSSDDEAEAPSEQSGATITRTMTVQEDKPECLLQDPQPTKPTTSAVEPVAPRTENQVSLDGESIPEDPRMDLVVAIPVIDLTVSEPPSPQPALEDQSQVMDPQTHNPVPVVDMNTLVQVMDATIPAVDVLIPVAQDSQSPSEDQSQVVELEIQPSMPIVDAPTLLADATTPAVVDPIPVLQASPELMEEQSESAQVEVQPASTKSPVQIVETQEPMEIEVPPTTEPSQSPPPILELQAPIPVRKVKILKPKVFAPPTQSVTIPPKPTGIPVRKSKRINKEDERNENELIANFNNGIGGLDRGTTIPIGLHRIPFDFKDKAADDKAERVKDQLKINMQPVFTPAGPLSQGFPPIPSVVPNLKRTRPETFEPITEESTTKYMKMEKKDRTPRIRVGVDFQAKIDSEVKEWNSEMMEDEDEKEELMWKPLKFETQEGILVDVEQDSEEIEFYDRLRNFYWRAIWRQFEGHIPMEIALQHLMKNQYKFSKSLWTIDENLKNLPQVFKPPCMAQVKLFQHLLKNKKKSRRILQEKAMKNYHVGEIQHFYYQFRRFYKYQEKHPEDCDCFEPLHKNVIFEPRYACSHCTKKLRTFRIPRDKKSIRNERLCLLCRTIQKLTGKLRLRSREIILNEDEKLKIEQWNEKERQLKRHVPREEFEEMISNENTEKWKREIVTPEENSMLNFKELRIPNRKSKNHLTDEEKQKRGQKVAAQLQPFILPLYTKCNCRKVGIISYKSLNFKKDDFSRIELDKYTEAIRNNNGNLEKAAIELDVELELVRKFSTIYAVITEILEFFPNNEVPVFEPIEMPPRSNLPPIIPDSSSSSNSRDGSPYIPPEEREKANKRRRVN